MQIVDIVKSFVEYGIFAGLFVYLFLKTQKDCLLYTSDAADE